ncbi:TatD family hydrolase [Oceanospirillum linum]|uniref:Hydrolase TatD n=1 Tax=Oceanospirillum linum TaxID=966 RepID=A0A1T1H876_OCELI|nr:TatD family hydrolase [Oceanospirillum linum]OOV85930.1 hypothetical protein BTA35_0215565 [Oceanospirillum linum]SEG45724.1 TatD DNase family protein [Oleiphilus messinensis]SMP34718.1 TatD DNase family protein [Oceanospirillum linum]
MLTDSHCHLDFNVFHHDRAIQLHQAFSAGVRRIVVPSVARQYWQRTLQLSGEFCGVRLYPALGLHPFFIAEHSKNDLNILDSLLAQYSGRIAGVGEIGLDFSKKKYDEESVLQDSKEQQLELFEGQLMLAQKHKLPVILHVVKAHDQTLKLLRQYPDVNGVVHAYSGSLSQAEQYIKQGFKIGVGGAITWPTAKKKRELFALLPLESLVLETDAPDMAPDGLKGQRNTPDQVALIARFLAECRDEPESLIHRVTSDNVEQVLQLTDPCSP